MALGVTLGWPPEALGQSPASWDGAEVGRWAARHHPDVRAAMAALDVARAGRVFGQVPVVGNPILGVLMLPGYPDFGAYTMTASLGIPLDVSGRRSRYRAEVGHDIAAAEARLDAVRSRAASEARQAYVDLVTTRSEVDIQRARLAAAESIEAVVRARVDAGAATAVDQALVERERAEAEADLAEANRRRTAADGALRRTLDLTPTEALPLSPLERPTPLSPVERTQAGPRAQRQRRDVSALERGAARWVASDDRLRAGAIAPLVLGLEGQQVATSSNDLGSSLGASVRWELPLAQRAQGERAVAQAEASGLRVQAVLLRRQVDRDVATAAEGLDAALAELDALTGRALPAAERLVAATEASWAAGALDIFRVLTARRDLLSVRARILTATRASWRARIEYDRAMGQTP